MVSTRSLAAALIITLLVSIQVSAITPDRGLENPLLLSEIGYGSLVYGSFNLDTQHYLVSYAEYDVFAEGHGAFIYQVGQDDEADIFSFVGTKELDHTQVGFTLHRFSNPVSEWLVDLGVAYTAGDLVARVAVHSIPLSDIEQIHERSSISVGAALNLADLGLVGLDARLQEQQYEGYVVLEPRPDFTLRFSLRSNADKWDKAGFDLWYTRDRLIGHVAVVMSQNWQRDIRLGFGIRF